MSTISRRAMLGRMGLALGAGQLATSHTAGAETKRPPNFVVIFADDLGYGDLGCYGAEKIKTPNLDQMAQEGLKFTSFYVCAPVCSPSRAGLLTGRYPIRSGLTRVLFPNSKSGIDDSERTIADVLKKSGYTTACIGKWHLGHLAPHLPTRHGFDQYYGIPYSNDMNSTKRGDPPVPLMRNEEIIEQPVDQNTVTKRYTEEAVRFIREQKDTPFFLYMPHTMPHIPLFVSDDFRDKSAGGLYGDVIEEIDWSVGQILAELKAQGLDENTLVVFTSDNGPWLVMQKHGGSAGTLREGKGTTFEGGMRVPCIARWPGKIEAGRVTNEPASTLDFLPTLATLAGGTPPQDRILDGGNIGPQLFGAAKREDFELFYYRNEELRAIRSGKWKLKRPVHTSVYGKRIRHPVLLFDLESDPEEKNDLSHQDKKRVIQLEHRMKEFHATLGDVPEPKK